MLSSMAVQALIKFQQGVTIGAPGVALEGVLTTQVTATNAGVGDVPIQYIWTWIDTPHFSAIPRGEIIRGNFPSVNFEPDVVGDYHLELQVFNQGGQRSIDRRVFRVQRVSGRYIPAFDAEKPAMNFDLGGGNLNERGWARDMEAWLEYLDAIVTGGGATTPGGSIPQFQFHDTGDVFQGASGLSYDKTNNWPKMPNGWAIDNASFRIRFTGTPATSNKTITFQNATDTVVMRDTSDTLTNKSLTSPAVTGIPAFATTRNEFTPTTGGSLGTKAYSQTDELQTTDATANQTLASLHVDSSYGDCRVSITAEVQTSFTSDSLSGGKYLFEATASRVGSTWTITNLDDTDETLMKGQVMPHPAVGSVDSQTLAVQVTGALDVTVNWTSSVHVQITPQPLASGTAPLYDFNFTTLSLGFMSAAAFQTRTGLTFSRSSTSTVQTSASTIVDGGIADYAAIGNTGSTLAKRGLVIQHNTFNRLSAGSNVLGPRQISGSPWSTGSSVTTTYPSDSPDQANSGGTRVVCTSGGYGNYYDFGADNSDAMTLSSWQKGATDMQMGWENNGNTQGNYVNATANSIWQRLSLTKASGTGRRYFNAVDGENKTGFGGQSARARDCNVDYVMVEDGPFMTEAIENGALARAFDNIARPTGSTFISPSNGQFRFYAKLSPKHASSQQVFWRTGTSTSGTEAAWYLWSWGGAGTSYAKVKDSDKKLYVKIQGGSEVVSTNAISWSAGDTVEIYLAVGNNVASKAKYRINGGSWVDLVLATIADAPNPSSGAIRLFSNDNASTGDAGSFPAWIHRVTVLDNIHYPGT
jgi:hypothetical protein